MYKKLIIFAAIVCVIIFLGRFFFSKPKDLSTQAKALDEQLSMLLEKIGAKPAALIKKETQFKKGFRTGAAQIEAEYQLCDFPAMPVFAEILTDEIKSFGFDTLKFKYAKEDEVSRLSFDFGYKRNFIYRLVLKQKAEEKPKAVASVAIVIDDWGYNKAELDELFQIKSPLTLAILPNLKNSADIAKISRMKGYEVILHLPLEPQNEKLRKEKTTIYTDMGKKEIIETFENNLSSVPFAKGISNHMGSKATEDKRVMEIIFSRLKKKNLFFLDSLVTEQSLGRELTEEKKVRFAKRSVFLDNELNPEYINNQFLELIEIAKKRGAAIGICHDKEVTLKTIKANIDKFKGQGIEFVYLSQLVH